MKNSNISDFVAVAMDTVLKSDEHKSLFATQYKYASDEKDASCHVCKQSLCVCNKNKANDNDVKDSSDDYSSSSSDSSSSSSESDGSSSEDYDTKDHMDSSYADDDALQVSAAFDVAIDGLLTASAALDSIGLSNGSSLSLKLATLVVNAKKRDPAAVSSKAKKDSQMAKDKLAKEKAKKEKDMQSAKDKLAKEKAVQLAKDKLAKEKAKKEKDMQSAKDKLAKEKAAKEKAMVAKSSK